MQTKKIADDQNNKCVKGRFACVDEETHRSLIENCNAPNTNRSTTTAVSLFREYLTCKGISADFACFDNATLDKTLSKFYLEMRNRDGQMSKKSTFIAYMHGIQRHLKKSRNDIDIIKGEDFKSSIQTFKCMTKELKKRGLGAIEHYPSISDDDLEKIYTYLTENAEDVKILQYKVFLDLMLHFGRRGREHLANLKRSDFAVKHDENGQMYIYKTLDEQTKTHQDDSCKSDDGRMYQILRSERCPVRTFVKYVKRLNPKCQSLFQQPRNEPKNCVYLQ